MIAIQVSKERDSFSLSLDERNTSRTSISTFIHIFQLYLLDHNLETLYLSRQSLDSTSILNVSFANKTCLDFLKSL